MQKLILVAVAVAVAAGCAHVPSQWEAERETREWTEARRVLGWDMPDSVVADYLEHKDECGQ